MRFRDEARLLGQLRHRHIVKVDGLVRVSGRWAVVMEYVEGWDGNVVIKACRKAREPFPIAACLDVCASVASALDAAWSTVADDEPLRVIHRDIKPSNIRLTMDGDVKVLDFGIARADFRGREAMTRSVRYGSVRYMAPERRLERPDGAAGDIYSLGAVLYEFLVGRPLGNAELEEPKHTLKVKRSMERVERRCGKAAGPIIELMSAMLHYSEHKRPQAGAVAAACRKLVRSVGDDDLETFALRFFGQVGEIVSDGSRQVDRLVEGKEEDEAGEQSTQFPETFDEGAEESTSLFTPLKAAAQLCMVGALVQLFTMPLPGHILSVQGANYSIGPSYASAAAVNQTLTVRFSLPNASSIKATCNDIEAMASDTVTLRGVSAGTCLIVATSGELEHKAEVTVTRDYGFRCAVEDGVLGCM